MTETEAPGEYERRHGTVAQFFPWIQCTQHPDRVPYQVQALITLVVTWKKVLQLVSPHWTSFQAAHLAANRPAVLALGWGASTRRTTPSLTSSLPLLPVVLLPQKNYKHTVRAQQDVTATYPSLHEDVVNAFDNVPAPAPLFNHDGCNSEVINDYNTSIMGRFACQNPKCSSTGWSSKKIAIQIRGFRDNTYDALVFKQRCRTCQHLGTMRINKNSYIERFAYRPEKWAGVPMEAPEYNAEERGPPHESSLCEGCNAGRCPMLEELG
ncbi:hypothetical protein OQA88_8957 [Cercophora sp. LCS_1]